MPYSAPQSAAAIEEQVLIVCVSRCCRRQLAAVEAMQVHHVQGLKSWQARGAWSMPAQGTRCSRGRGVPDKGCRQPG